MAQPFVCFLAQHKAQLGRKYLSAVHIFKGDADNVDYPSLKWTVDDWTQELEDGADVLHTMGYANDPPIM